MVPFVNGRRVRSAVARIDVGGKLLTNHLKEIVSYRQLHVLDETYVMNCCREDCCYVSMDFDGDLREAEKRGRPDNRVARDYVLPDFTTLRFVPCMKSAKNPGEYPKLSKNFEGVTPNVDRHKGYTPSPSGKWPPVFPYGLLVSLKCRF